MEHEFGYLVDNVWWCKCGSLNAATLNKCNCGTTREEAKPTYPR